MIHIWLALRSTDPIVYFDKYFPSRQFITALQTASSFILSVLTQPWAVDDGWTAADSFLSSTQSVAGLARLSYIAFTLLYTSSMIFSICLFLCLPDFLFHAPILPVPSLVTWNSPCLGPGEMHFSCLHACITCVRNHLSLVVCLSF